MHVQEPYYGDCMLGPDMELCAFGPQQPATPNSARLPARDDAQAAAPAAAEQGEWQWLHCHASTACMPLWLCVLKDIYGCHHTCLGSACRLLLHWVFADAA